VGSAVRLEAQHQQALREGAQTPGGCNGSADRLTVAVTLGRLGAEEQHGHSRGGADQDREQDLVQQTGDGAAASGRFADLGDRWLAGAA
jgi:hypothetical protein